MYEHFFLYNQYHKRQSIKNKDIISTNKRLMGGNVSIKYLLSCLDISQRLKICKTNAQMTNVTFKFEV